MKIFTKLCTTLLIFSLFLILHGCASTSSKSTTIAPKTPATPGEYALLVPLHGKFSTAGQAVRDGFFAAYYQNRATGGIHIYDTSEKDIVSLYQQAQNAGASYIVGPLEKTSVERLLKLRRFPITTIALNYTESNLPNNFYEFGLSPEDEAVSVGNKIYQDNFKNVLIITQGGLWEQKIENTFLRTYQQLGGHIVESVKLGPQQNIMDQIQNTLTQQQISHTHPFKYQFDAIFLIAGNPAQARTIVPLIRMNGATTIPIYATSTIYNGTPDTTKDKDLNSVRFCDIPWLINQTTALDQLRVQLNRLWHSNGGTVRLYAFGIDAYQLTQQITKLTTASTNTYHGVTGTLSINNQRVRRVLPWAEFQNGEVVPLKQ